MKATRSSPTEPPNAGEGRGGRILLICYNYGPHNHTGGFRWRAMVRDLTPLGWRFDVIAVSPRDGREPWSDDPAEVHVVSPRWPLRDIRDRREQAYLRRQFEAGAKSATPGPPVDPANVPVQRPGQAMTSVETAKATALGAADLADDLVWVRRARRKARELAARRSYSAVIATSPFHLTHLVAADIASRFAVPYLADYRDPWGYGRGADLARLDPVTRSLWKRWERSCLREATAVVDIAEAAQRAAVAELADVEPALARLPRFYIANGYDPSPAEPPDPECFRVAYTGWLWPFMPLPSLLAACGRFRRERGLDRSRFCVQLVGSLPAFNGVPIEAIARGAGLDDCLEQTGRIPREDAEAVQRQAAALVAFDSVCAHGICIPSKLYHYAQYFGAILPIGNPSGGMAEEAAKIDVPTHSPDDQDGIAQALDDAWRRWSSGEMTRPNDPDGRFDSRRRSREMGQVLDAVVHRPDRLGKLEL